MLNFLQTEGQNEEAFKATNDLNPAGIIADIGAGFEELNTELIKYDVLAKAELALDKSIALDDQIAAQGVANKGTVAYGIEALEMTAIFLGAPIDVEAIAAGTEDNDQETPKEEKKGFLTKVKEAASNAWKKIKEIVEKIINKVKQFFSGKAAEKAKEELDSAADQVEKEVGSADKKPEKCNEKMKKNSALGIVKVDPVFMANNGIKTSKDFNVFLDYVTDQGPVKTAEEFGKLLSKDYVKWIEDLGSVLDDVKKATKRPTWQAAVKAIFTTGDAVSEVTKLTNVLSNEGVKFLKELKIPQIKMHPAKEKIVKEHEAEIIKAAGLKDVKDLEYTILYTGSTIASKNKNIFIDFVIIYKDKDLIKRFENLISQTTNMQTFERAVNMLNNALGVKTGKAPTKVNVDACIKNIEPFSSKELREIGEVVSKELPSRANEIANKLDAVLNKANSDAAKLQTPLNNLGQIGTNVFNFIQSVLNYIAMISRGYATSTTGIFTQLVNAESRLSKDCVKGDLF